jgi:allantoicase
MDASVSNDNQDDVKHPTEAPINLCSAPAGARILFATDEWFAAADRLLQVTPPVFDPLAYCPQGKVMDGWESRRRREPGHDWCIIQLSQRAFLLHAQVDTAYFTGNQAPAISIQALDLSSSNDDLAPEADWIHALPGATRRLLVQASPSYHIDFYRGTGATPDAVLAAEAACRNQQTWQEVLPRQALRPGYEESRHHTFPLATTTRTATHIRLNLFPDGGVARLRLYGVPVPTDSTPPPLYRPLVTGPACTVVSYDDAAATRPSQQVDAAWVQVSCLDHGGAALWGSNQHYGTPAQLLQAESGVDMGDGWETARSPQRPAILVAVAGGLVDFGDRSEECILRLGRPVARVETIIVDTQHFKGNYPESVEVQGCYQVRHDHDDDPAVAVWKEGVDWFPLIPRIRLSPHAEHCWEAARGQIPRVPAPGVSHVRVRIFPDGGLSRVRVYGRSTAH